MSKTQRFRTPFDSQHAKGSQMLLKPSGQNFHRLFSSLWRKYSWEMFLLVILGLFANTLTDDGKYSLWSVFSLNKKYFPRFLPHFLNLNQVLKKRWPSWLMYFRNYGLPKMGLEKCLKSPVKEHRSTVNMLKVPNTVDICTIELLSYFRITLRETEF